MEKEIMDEMKRAAELLDMPLDDVQSKFDDICKQNDIDMEKEQLLARGLVRQWYASVRKAKARNPSSEGGESCFKNDFGFCV